MTDDLQDVPPEPFEVWCYDISRDGYSWRRHTRSTAIDDVVVTALFDFHRKTLVERQLMRLPDGRSAFKGRLLPSILAHGLAQQELDAIKAQWLKFRSRPMRAAA